MFSMAGRSRVPQHGTDRVIAEHQHGAGRQPHDLTELMQPRVQRVRVLSPFGLEQRAEDLVCWHQRCLPGSR
jgi:hypothetical protein